MAKEKVGVRRLYDSVNCQLSEKLELEFLYPIAQEFEVSLYMGPKPHFGTAVMSGGKYITSFTSDSQATMQYTKDASQSDYPRNFFTEISILRTIDVSDELSIAFHQADSAAQNEILAIASERAEESRSLIDLIAGTIGLRLHRQFVLEQINENLIAIRDPLLIQITSDWLEVLEEPRLNSIGMTVLNNMLTDISKADKPRLLKAGTILSWLGRSWHERDSVYKFLSLFIPLEQILQGSSSASDPAFLQNSEVIRNLIRLYRAEEAGQLLAFFDSIAEPKRPSLEDRFIQLANHFKLPGWEADIKAFHRFNKSRNALLHRAEDSVALQVSLEKDEIRTLEDLVERYVSCSIFGNDVVYQSRWRPTRN